jgi:hypothetical protein
MDPIVARRLDSEEEFRKAITKTAKEYLDLGKSSADYWASDFDFAYDMMMSYAPLTREDLQKLEKGHPSRFILPVSATQLTTMATFITQMLFGQSHPHRVEGRGPEDEVPAEFLNQLLRWNSEQQQTYLIGYLWVQDALVTNKAVMYNSWSPLFETKIIPESVPDPTKVDEFGLPTQIQRFRRKSMPAGGYNKMELVSPYDFVCDPSLPFWRIQEMRFCGHKTEIPWQELKRRSSLPVEDPAYVSAKTVERLKTSKGKTGSSAASAGVGPTTGGKAMLSRTAYERSKSSNPAGTDKAGKSDPGVVSVHELWVRMVPKDSGIYNDSEDVGEDPVMFQILIANGNDVLAINESTYDHGEYPYSVGEARPIGQIQNSPSWAVMLKGVQDYMDWLKNRHQDALSRTIGNVFIADPSKVDLDDFLNPEKEGLIISLKPEGQGTKLSECIQQVPLRDMTERFIDEMADFARMSESVTGVNSSMQGQMDQNPSATQFAGTQQMSAGRMASVARMLSVQGLVPQTRQFVANFQQFMEEPQMIRFVGDSMDRPKQLADYKAALVTRDAIQGKFDYTAHDGTLPGTDGRKVAALSKMVESMTMFPDLFVPGPGNLDPRKIFFALAKASGLNVENFRYEPDDLPQMPPPGMPPPGMPPGMGEQQGPQGPGLPPGPQPAMPTLPDIQGLSLESAAPPEIRPSQI